MISNANTSDLLTLQEYLFNGLLSCDLFDVFNIVQERRFMMESEMNMSTIWQRPREGKKLSGIGLLVEMPKLEIPKPNSLQRNVVASIAIVEERNINMTQGVGTTVSAEELGELALDFMFGWMLGFTSGLTPETGALVPAPDVAEQDAIIAYRAAVSMRREHKAVARCDKPTIAEGPAGTFTLNNGINTPDADLYYTLDGSFPGKSNPAAVKYAAPLQLASGSIITIAAWRNDRLPSHIAPFAIS